MAFVPPDMQAVTWRTPVAASAVLTLGWAIFSANAYLPVPWEGVVGELGMIVFASGVCLAVYGAARSIIHLGRPSLRQTGKLVAPVVTIALTVTTLVLVLFMLITAKRTLDQRGKTHNCFESSAYGSPN
jgi:hypothetical protein